MKRISRFLVLGVVVLFVLGFVLTYKLWQAHLANGEQSLGLFAYFAGMLATAILIVCFVLLALRLHSSPISQKVLAALTHVLKRDEDPRVRAEAAVGLSELDKEASSHYYEHNQLDETLISALKDRDSSVRSKVVEGLTEVELEPFTHHEPDQLEDALLEDMARAYKQK